MDNLDQVIQCLVILVLVKSHWAYMMCSQCNIQTIDASECKRLCADDRHVRRDLTLHDDWKLELICRGETSLSISFLSAQADLELRQRGIKAVIYKIQKSSKTASSGPSYYIRDEVTGIQLNNLTESSSYKISVCIYSEVLQIIGASKEYSFDTLAAGYVPGKPRNITLEDVSLDEHHLGKLKALLKWEPAEDANCDFEITSTSESFGIINVQHTHYDKGIFKLDIDDIEMGKIFEVGIRGKRLGDSHLQGKKIRKKFRMPICLDLPPCALEEPQGLKFKRISSSSMEISWDHPKMLPEYYVIWVQVYEECKSPSLFDFKIYGSETGLYIEDLNGTKGTVKIRLEAYLKGLFSVAMVTGSLPGIQNKVERPGVSKFSIPFVWLSFLCGFLLLYVIFIMIRENFVLDFPKKVKASECLKGRFPKEALKEVIVK